MLDTLASLSEQPQSRQKSKSEQPTLPVLQDQREEDKENLQA
jgi:hypothetical protein